MKFPSRLRAFDFWGAPEPPALPYFFSACKDFDLARKERRVKNLRRYGSESEGSIGLEFTTKFPADLNAKSLWSPSTNLEEFPARWRGGDGQPGANAVGYIDNAPDANVRLTGPKIPKNTGFAIRAFLFQPPREQTLTTNWAISVGNFEFRVKDGRGEATVYGPDADDESYTPVAMRGTTGEGFYDNAFTIVFIPEPCGRVHIIFQNGEGDALEHKEIQDTRETGTLWEEMPIIMTCNGGAFFWQLGYPEFLTPGEYSTGRQRKDNYWADAFGDLITNHYSDTSLSGASVEITKEDLDSVTWELKTTLTSSNNRITPFFYFGQGLIGAGPRTGTRDQAWDSDEHLDDHGNSPILDIVSSYEGTMRRAQHTVIMRDPKGAVLAGIDGDFHYEALENRTNDLSLGGPFGGALATDGIVMKAELHEMNSATSNQIRSVVCGASTYCTLTICDQWALLDEDLMLDDCILDNKYLCTAIRIVLENAGIQGAALAGIANEDSIAFAGMTEAQRGPRLHKAALWEDPAVRPSEEISRGDFLRFLMEEFGYGWELFISELGVWTFRKKSTAIKQLFGHNVAFSTNPALITDTTYPGRFWASKIDMSRDTSEFYNTFRAVGKNGISKEHRVQESIWASGGSGNKKFIGRIKRKPSTRNEGLRTQSQVAYSLRCQVHANDHPPRFHAIRTAYHRGLYPGDICTLDGVLCIVKAINDASVARDEMTLVLQEY